MSNPPYPPGSAGSSPPAGYPYPPQRIVLEQPATWFGKLGKLLWFALAVSVLINISLFASRKGYSSRPRLQERLESGNEAAQDKIAIIRVEGGIIEGDGFVKRQIDQVREDDHVKALVVRINSPGGTVTASNYIFHHLKELRKDKIAKEGSFPLVVSMGSICASGGYYVAMAAGDQEEVIFAEPATWTGSIGVIIPHYDLSGLLERWDVTDDSIASHKFKQLGSPTRKLSEVDRAEERKILQTLVDESFEDFKDIVREGRPALAKDDAKLDSVATGQVFTAKQAEKLDLVDRIGFVEDAVLRASELAKLAPDTYRVVRYDRPPSLFDSLSGTSASANRPEWNLEALLDLTAPRAYYLSTWLPAVLTNSRP